MLFFQDEGKTRSLLFTLSSPFQKKVSLMPPLKKKNSQGLFIRRHLVPFRLGITHWSSVLFLFELRYTWQGCIPCCSGDVKCWEWERQRVGTESGDVGFFAIGQQLYNQPVNHPNHWAWNNELMNWSPLHSWVHTYSVLTFTYIPHNLWTWIIP